ncbi:13_t:CDS:2 [Rhizophagus irregularis]|nr:13_t:CDS:2 [Rhizophagus irregularis]
MGGRENSIECWWSYVEQDEGEENFIQQLALKIFSITPYNAGCERIFSVIGWYIYEQKKNDHLQNITKLHTYYVLNAKTELKFTAKDLNVTNEEEFYQLFKLSRISGRIELPKVKKTKEISVKAQSLMFLNSQFQM